MLEVDALTKRFGPLLALDDVGFTVEPGQIVGFLGPNGAGKTTTMRAIMGLVAIDAGTVTWNGTPVDAPIRQRFGYMPAERGMYQRMKIRDHLSYYARLSGHRGDAAGRAADGWMERLGLADRSGDTVQSLSSGNQQRVQIALALINDPALMALDEPFSGLDPVAVDVLSDILREQVTNGAALLLSSHQLDLVADICSDVVIVDHGRVVMRGDVARLRAASDRRYVEVEFEAPTEWRHGSSEATVSQDGRRYRLALGAGDDANRLIADAHSQGPVVEFSFAPPDLSEVFLAAVGRSDLNEGVATNGEVSE